MCTNYRIDEPNIWLLLPWSIQHEDAALFSQIQIGQVFWWRRRHLSHLPYKQMRTLQIYNVNEPQQSKLVLYIYLSNKRSVVTTENWWFILTWPYVRLGSKKHLLLNVKSSWFYCWNMSGIEDWTRGMINEKAMSVSGNMFVPSKPDWLFK